MSSNRGCRADARRLCDPTTGRARTAGCGIIRGGDDRHGACVLVGAEDDQMPQPQPEAASASTLRELVGSLVRTDSAGARVISDAELEDLIPLLVLGADLSRSTPSPALLSKLTAFFERAGIDPRAPIPEVQGRLDAWLVQYPPSPEALRVLEEVLGGAAIAAGSHRGLRGATRSAPSTTSGQWTHAKERAPNTAASPSSRLRLSLHRTPERSGHENCTETNRNQANGAR